MSNSTFAPHWNFDNTYVQLPPTFYVKQGAGQAKAPHLMVFNHGLAERLGLDGQKLVEQGADIFAGNAVPPGAEPLAQAYAGHQFGNFTMLGDGRALLLGEQIAPDGTRFDIQLKGSGRTPFSRSGDGKAALGPMLREYLISEAMHALGIPTTRSLAVVTTGEPVYRDEILPGAVLTRVASSHIRVGTFEYAALRGPEAVKTLADYTINRHYPELREAENKYLALLQAVIDRQAVLVAKWMHAGFVHGVMNTDNMAVSGETIDYGPCAFMDVYDPKTVFSSIDNGGRYAYGNQPVIAQWNLARFAETLLPVMHEDIELAIPAAEAAVLAFTKKYEQAWLAGMRAKLGLLDEAEEDATLANDLLTIMQRHKMDFTNAFRQLATQQSLPAAEQQDVHAWLARWQLRFDNQLAVLERRIEVMRYVSPAVIPRNHLVEAALEAAVKNNDLEPFNKFLDLLSTPYREPEGDTYRQPAPASIYAYRTFCGT